MDVRNDVDTVPERVITALLYKPSEYQDEDWRNLAPETEGWFYPADLNPLVEYPTHVPRVRKQLVKEGYAELKTIKTTDKKGRPVEKLVIRLKRDNLTFLKLWLWAIQKGKNGIFMDSDYFSSNPTVYTPLLVEYASEFVIPRSVMNDAKKRGYFQQFADKLGEVPQMKSVNPFTAFPFMACLVYFQPRLFNLYHEDSEKFQRVIDEVRKLSHLTPEQFLLSIIEQGALNSIMDRLLNAEKAPKKLDTSDLRGMGERYMKKPRRGKTARNRSVV